MLQPIKWEYHQLVRLMFEIFGSHCRFAGQNQIVCLKSQSTCSIFAKNLNLAYRYYYFDYSLLALFVNTALLNTSSVSVNVAPCDPDVISVLCCSSKSCNWVCSLSAANCAFDKLTVIV